MGEQALLLFDDTDKFCAIMLVADLTLEQATKAACQRWRAKLAHGYRIAFANIVSVQEYVVSTSLVERGKLSRRKSQQDAELGELMSVFEEDEEVEEYAPVDKVWTMGVPKKKARSS